MNRKEAINRREFMRRTGAGSAAGVIALNNLEAFESQERRSPSDRITVGMIGTGARAQELMQAIMEVPGTQIVAACDAYQGRLTRTQERTRGSAKIYKDYREVLADKSINAVVIATPDHWHRNQVLEALQAGKDVYCEKPMATVLQQARDAVKAVQASRQVVEIGTQRRSDGKYRQAQQMMKEKVIGDITHVDIRWNVMQSRWRRKDVNEVEERDTDWKRFLMYRPYRPFDKHLYMEWRLYRDFSSGIPDQWLSHQLDVVHWFTGDPHPLSCVASGGVYYWKDGRENEDTITVVYEYAKGFQVTDRKSVV